MATVLVCARMSCLCDASEALDTWDAGKSRTQTDSVSATDVRHHDCTGQPQGRRYKLC